MAKKKVYRSGMLPYYVKEENGSFQVYILFMRPSDAKYGGNEFQVAKGKQEEGENPKQTAYREAKEELGLFSGNVEHDFHLGNFLGRTEVFICKIKDPDMFGDPHFETAETKWLTPWEFKKVGRDLHKPIVDAAFRWIRRKEKI